MRFNKAMLLIFLLIFVALLSTSYAYRVESCYFANCLSNNDCEPDEICAQNCIFKPKNGMTGFCTDASQACICDNKCLAQCQSAGFDDPDCNKSGELHDPDGNDISVCYELRSYECRLCDGVCNVQCGYNGEDDPDCMDDGETLLDSDGDGRSDCDETRNFCDPNFAEPENGIETQCIDDMDNDCDGAIDSAGKTIQRDMNPFDDDNDNIITVRWPLDTDCVPQTALANIKGWDNSHAVKKESGQGNAYVQIGPIDQIGDATGSTAWLKSSYIRLSKDKVHTWSNALDSETQSFIAVIELYNESLDLIVSSGSPFGGIIQGFSQLSTPVNAMDQDYYVRLHYRITGNEGYALVDNVSLRQVIPEGYPTLDEAPGGFYPSSCCPAAQCWNGTHCQDPSDPNLPPIFGTDPAQKGYRCVLDAQTGLADWKELAPMKNWDWTEEGVCTRSDECFISETPRQYLVNNSITVSDLRCISAGSFIGDHYCILDSEYNPRWTTRTAIIASYLKNISKNKDYSLYCDESELALVDHTNPALTTQGIFNDFCILRYEDGGDDYIIIGTSLNVTVQDANDLSAKLSAFYNGQSPIDCTDAYGNEEGFMQCSTDSGSLFYHNKSGLVIFTEQDIALLPEKIEDQTGFWSKLWNFIAHPFESVFGWFEEENQMELPEDFDRVYMAKEGEKNITGYARNRGQGAQQSSIAVQYSGLSDGSGVCYGVDGFVRYFPENSPFACSSAGTLTNVSAAFKNVESTIRYNKSIDKTWQSLTSRNKLVEGDGSEEQRS